MSRRPSCSAADPTAALTRLRVMPGDRGRLVPGDRGRLMPGDRGRLVPGDRGRLGSPRVMPGDGGPPSRPNTPASHPGPPPRPGGRGLGTCPAPLMRAWRYAAAGSGGAFLAVSADPARPGSRRVNQNASSAKMATAPSAFCRPSSCASP